MAVLKSGKVDFRANKIITGRGTLQNDKNVEPLRRYSIPKFVFTKQKSYKIGEAKADKAERRIDESVISVEDFLNTTL